jgi:hypothetical protein
MIGEMIMPRRFIIPCVLLLFFAGVSARRAAAQDDTAYDTSLVKSALQDNALGVSIIEKRVNRLGDRAAIALIRVLEDSDLKNPQKVKRVLQVIRVAFLHPNLITSEEDKKPKFTLLFLEHVGSEVKDSALKREISDLTKFVKEPARKGK